MTDGYKDTSNFILGETSSNLSLGAAAIKNTIVGVNDWTDTTIGAGFNNTVVGFNAGKKITSGKYNTLVGTSAGQFIVGGSSNVFIGNNSGVQAANAGSQNRIALGAGITHQLGNNIAVIGNASVTDVYLSYDAGATAHAAAFTESSDLKLKNFIKPLDYGLSYILKLKPVSYYWNGSFSGDETLQIGLIAQDIEKVNADMQIENQIVHKAKSDEDAMGVEYSKLVVPLIKAVQELNEEIEKLKAEIQELKK